MKVFISLVLFCFWYASAAVYSDQAGVPPVRVLITRGVSGAATVYLGASGKFILKDSVGREIARGGEGDVFSITSTSDPDLEESSQAVIKNASTGAVVGAFNSGDSGASLTLASGGEKIPLWVASVLHGHRQQYWGQIVFTALPRGALRILNLVDIENYVAGVLKAEIGANAPAEALKAQAVAARSYAIRHLGSFVMDDADVDDTSRSQGYLGKSGETQSTLAATAATRGLVLIYNGAVIDALYSTDCGGVTAQGSPDEPYLRAIADKNCASHFHWSFSLSSADLIQLFVKSGRLLNKNAIVTRATVVKQDESGRIVQIEFDFKDGLSVVAGGVELRSLIGSDKMRSTLCNISVDKSGTVSISGRGWGHGLGLCQTGAVARAATEAYSQILADYYPGTQLTAITEQIIQASKSPSRGRLAAFSRSVGKFAPPSVRR